MPSTCQALVVTCIDFRFQQFIDDWIKDHFGVINHDRVAWAGGVKDFFQISNQLEISKRLHDIKEVVIINHEDCGAYGMEGTPQKHAEDLRNAADYIKSVYPDLDVKCYYLHLDGIFDQLGSPT